MTRKLSVIFFSLICILSCGGETVVRSSAYPTAQKRVERLKELFVLRSDVKDAAYEIYDVNMNTRSIPGPTDRDYKIVLKVSLNDLEKWNEPEIITSLPQNYDWAEELLKGLDGWDLSGSIIQYANENKHMVIFKDTGVILVRIVQH